MNMTKYGIKRAVARSVKIALQVLGLVALLLAVDRLDEVVWKHGGGAQAQTTQGLTAQETAQLGVNTLLQTIEDSRELFNSDREAYFEQIEEVVGQFVDFDVVAEVVMNRYAAYATPRQKARFADILKSTLTRFYGAALVNYTNVELVFLPGRRRSDDPRADQIVSMELKGEVGLRLQYQMFLNENDEWKLKNVSLSGINLGRQYYTQFAALMAQHDNDIEAVLDNWK